MADQAYAVPDQEGIQPVASAAITAEDRRKRLMVWGFGTIIVGILLALAGLVMFTLREPIASNFLGAKLLFGLPVTELDAQKVHAVSFWSLAALGQGALAFAAGIVLALRGHP